MEMSSFATYVFSMTEEEQMFQKLVREFIERELGPLASSVLLESQFPADSSRPSLLRETYWKVFDALRRNGYTGLALPEEYGGTPCSSKMTALFTEEVCRIDGAAGLPIGATLSLVAAPVAIFGTVEQKKLWLPKIAGGEKFVACYCQTEAEAGSDVANIKTRARKQGDVWILDGTKDFITNGSEASLALVIARTDEHPQRGLTAFLVDLAKEKEAGRVRILRNDAKGGLHLSPTSTIVFNGACAEILGGDDMLNRGWSVALNTLVGSRATVIPAQALGIAQGAFEIAQSYSLQRKVFGRALHDFPRLKEFLDEMELYIALGRLLCWRACFWKDHYQNRESMAWQMEASQAKLFCSEIVEKVTSQAIQILGGFGYLTESRLPKFWHDGRVIKIYEGTSQVQELIITEGIARRLKECAGQSKLSRLKFLLKRPWILAPQEEQEFQRLYATSLPEGLRATMKDLNALRRETTALLIKGAQELRPSTEERQSNMFHPFWHDLAWFMCVSEAAKLFLWKHAWQINNKQDVSRAEHLTLLCSELLEKEYVKLKISWRYRDRGGGKGYDS